MKLSVALCTYNGEKYISEQLDSILNQNMQVQEIIIVDDCSSDRTFSILNKYESLYSIIKLYRNEITLGYLKNFEKAINLCSGDIIFLSDQDDIWLQEKTQKICDLFLHNCNISCVVTDLKLINSEGTLLNKTFFGTLFKDTPVCKTKSDVVNFLIKKGNFAAGAGMAFKRKQVDFINDTCFVHDAQIIISSLKDDGLYVDDNSYTDYRIHGSQSIGLRNNKERGNKMLDAYERFKRAEYIYGVLGNGESVLSRLKIDFLIEKIDPLIKLVD